MKTKQYIDDGRLAELRSGDLFGVWLPIETAPHDSITWVLVVEAGGEIHLAIWDDFEGEYHGKQWTDGHLSLNPTHWMPLPLPPFESELERMGVPPAPDKIGLPFTSPNAAGEPPATKTL